jgi:hypothetical protein
LIIYMATGKKPGHLAGKLLRTSTSKAVKIVSGSDLSQRPPHKRKKR